MADIHITEWYADDVIKSASDAADTATKKGAEMVLAGAKSYINANAKNPTGHLTSEIDLYVADINEGVGYVVEAQGAGKYTGKYHAVFVELGNMLIHPYGNKSAAQVRTPSIPYLRETMKKNYTKIFNLFKNAMGDD